MSALPPKADIRRGGRGVRFVPIADRERCSKFRYLLFDYLVGAGEQRWRHVKAERLRGLEVDDQLVLGRRLHWQVGRFLALEDAIDIASRSPVLVDHIGPVGDQAAAGDKVSG